MLKKFLGDVAAYGSGDFVIKFISFSVFPIYAHIFTVDQFGVMSLVTTTAGFFAIFLSMGSSHAVQRFYWDPHTKEIERPVIVSTGLWMLIANAVTLTLVILISLYFIRQSIRELYGIPWMFLLLALASNVPSEILQFSQNVLRLHFSPWRFTVVSACNNLIGVLLGLFFILYLDLGLTGFFLGAFTGLFFSFPLGLWLIRQDLRANFDRIWSIRLLKFGYPFIFAGVAFWIFGSLDRWMLSQLSNNTEVGWYSIAFKFATVIILLNAAFGQAWSPHAMKVYAGDPEYRRKFSETLSWLFAGLTLIGLVLSLFSKELLMVMTPEPYWNASTALGVIAMSMVFAGTMQVTALGISLEKQTHLFSILTWVSAVLNFLMNLILIPFYGATGAAVATLISYAALSAAYLHWTQKLHPMPLQNSRLLFVCLILVVGLIVSAILNRFPWSANMVAAKLAFIAAAGAVAFLSRLFQPSTKLFARI
jgi:O-antigen/teichoic acid export membrane protein